MGTTSLHRGPHRGGYHNWLEITAIVAIALLLIAAAYLMVQTPQVGRMETSPAGPDVARYRTLAGVAGVRALDRDIGAERSAETLYARLRGIAAVRAFDAGRASAQPARGHLASVADVRAVDRAFELARPRLNLNGVAAVRALDQ